MVIAGQLFKVIQLKDRGIKRRAQHAYAGEDHCLVIMIHITTWIQCIAKQSDHHDTGADGDTRLVVIEGQILGEGAFSRVLQVTHVCGCSHCGRLVEGASLGTNLPSLQKTPKPLEISVQPSLPNLANL
eukprot:1158005-Pelagomonas_calceolata.AAC.6